MAKEVVLPRIRGYICTTAHPGGCAHQVGRQIAIARRDPATWGRGKMLVLGASTGYGMASRIAGAFGHGMDTVGVFYERPATEQRTASAGWYNSAAFHREAHAAGLHASSINGDAFSTEVLERTLAHLRDTVGPLDVVVYSLASPVRTDPETAVTYRSVLKTVGAPITTKSVDLATDKVLDMEIEAATPEEIASTVAVMGGTDMRRWVDALRREQLLAPGAKVVAYTYIGPRVTYPVYRSGTIGKAKEHLEATARDLHEQLAADLGGQCRVVVCKSVVTQSSSAIPGVPLYMSILFKVMKAAGTHEGPVEQMARLFEGHLGPGRTPKVDDEGFIRLDNLELRPEIQHEVGFRWSAVETDNLRVLSDYDGYQHYFRELFGYDVPGMDYNVPVETIVPLE
jgi:enoyl-[acyl-carrier protein] reductase / trans-2-enoyl-CoA reductase (NAD+)